MQQIIYLDNNATTRVDPEVAKSMLPFFTDNYANPSSIHFFGEQVANEIDSAREIIASSINCSPEEVIFTGSGSEANNLCIKGFCYANRNKGNHIITSRIEHPSVINTCKSLEAEGFEVTYLDVDQEGFIDLSKLEKSIRNTTILMTIMTANNEIGTIQDLTAISKICSMNKIAFHTDAVQAYLKIPIDVDRLDITMASFSGHKIHVPKGIGFTYIKTGTLIKRITDGGSQELKLRAGTENTPYIMALSKGIELSSTKDISHMKKIQEYLYNKLKKMSHLRINGPIDMNKRICNNIHFSTSQLSGEMLLELLSDSSICVSTGSACSSKSTSVSPVLTATNCPSEFIHGSIRVSISKYTTKSEIDIFIHKLEEILLNNENPLKLTPL